MTSIFNPFGDMYGNTSRPSRRSFFGGDDEDDYYYSHPSASRQRQYERLLRQRQYEEALRQRQYEEAMRQRRYEEALRQRQYEEALRQRQYEEALFQHKQQQQQQRRPRQARPVSRRHEHLLRVQTLAATIIQRAYRRHLARRAAARSSEAAAFLADWYIRARDQRAIRRSLPMLAKIGAIRREMQDMMRELEPVAFSAPPRPDGRLPMPLLEVEDKYLKMLLRLDAVMAGDNLEIRAQRKMLANDLNARLDAVERVKKDMLARKDELLKQQQQQEEEENSWSMLPGDAFESDDDAMSDA
mgnify:CR=1 FL=1